MKITMLSCKYNALKNALAVFVTIFLASCSTEPVAGRWQGTQIKEGEDNALNEACWYKYCSGRSRTGGTELQEFISGVGRNLTEQIDNGQRYGWEFRLVRDNTPTIFGLSNGKVAISDSLFRYISNEAELAAVLSHTIAHVISHHGSERLSQREGMVKRQGLLTTGLSPREFSEQDKWMEAHSGAVGVIWQYPFSRGHEASADRQGLLMMARAGYEPQAALEFWGKFMGIAALPCSFPSLHPFDVQRERELRQFLGEAEEIYRVNEKQIGYGAKLHLRK